MGFFSKILGIDLDGQEGEPGLQRSKPPIVLPETAEFKTKVEMVLDQVRPALRADGGDIQLVEIRGRSVRVKLTGACDGCASSALTLQYGIERKLRDAIPELETLIPS
jgi:Fe-S cluster biogenesis protein NfuA